MNQNVTFFQRDNCQFHLTELTHEDFAPDTNHRVYSPLPWLAPHPMFRIDELLRLVIEKLVEASTRTAVSSVLTSRPLEEPRPVHFVKKDNTY